MKIKSTTNSGYPLSIIDKGILLFMVISLSFLFFSCEKEAEDKVLQPIADAGSDTVVYDSNEINLYAKNPKAGSGVWYILKGNGGTILNPYDPQTKFSGNFKEKYELVWKVTNDNLLDYDTVSIEFIKNINPPVADAGNDKTVYDLTIVEVSGNLPASCTGEWGIIEGPDGYFEDSTSCNTIFHGKPDTTYILQWKLINESGSDSAQIEISFERTADPPVANAGKDSVINYETFYLYAEDPVNGNGQWKIIEGLNGNISEPTLHNSKFTGKFGNTYLLEWSVSNISGTDYDTVELKLHNNFTCGEDYTDPRDGQTYATVEIAGKCWFAENLNYGTEITVSSNQTDNGVPEKYCHSDLSDNCESYGALYQWNEVMNYSTVVESQGLCPAGWHVSSDEEWKEAETALGMSSSAANKMNAWRESNEGTKMKEGGSSGLEIKMGGRCASGTCDLLNNYTYLWTSNETGSTAIRRCLSSSSSQIGRWDTFPKSYGFSVRCVKD